MASRTMFARAVRPVAVVTSVALLSVLLVATGANAAPEVSPGSTSTSSPTLTPASLDSSDAPTSAPSAGSTPSETRNPSVASVLGPNERTSRIIVKYRDGVVATMDAGKPLGWNFAKTMTVVTGSELTDRMSTMDLAEPVDMQTAVTIANEIAQNPDVEWAEPDEWRYLVNDVSPMASTVDVTVSGFNGSATKSGAFSYTDTAPPTATATSISPTQGPISGGTVVTLTGTELMGATAVSVGGKAGTSFSVIDSTHVRFTTPAKSAGTFDVVVTTPNGNATLSPGFAFIAAPTLSATPLSKTIGSSLGGQSVTISGAGLSTTSGVTFGGTPAQSIASRTDTSVTVTTPARSASASPVNVVVTTAGGAVTATSAFTFSAPATVTSVSPISGLAGGGTSVTISGTGLLGTTSVRFGGTLATVTSKTATSIIVTTPAHAAGAVSVVVTGPTGDVTKTNAFNYRVAPPSLSSTSPTVGSVDGGTAVRLTGTNLGDVSRVTFDGISATIQSKTATAVNVVAPAHAAGVVNVIATGPGGASSPKTFTYQVPAPTISAVSPSSGKLSGGTVITITGTRLTGTNSVKFGTTAASAVSGSSISVISSTQVRVTTPAGSAGAKNIYLTARSGSTTRTNGFFYVAAPAITSFAPTSGPSGGGTTVTITGANLANASAVRFGSTAGTVTANTATSITVRSPAGAVSSAGVALSVVTPGGTSPAFRTKFIYVVAPASVPQDVATTEPSRETASRLDASPAVNTCANSSVTKLIQRCYVDSPWDAGQSVYAEATHGAAYVKTSNSSTLYVDVVSWSPMTNNTWLVSTSNGVEAHFDTNRDGAADVKLVAPNSSVASGSTVAALVYDRPVAGGSWSMRGGTGLACSASIGRPTGLYDYSDQTGFWRFSVDWACLFGAGRAASSIAAQGFLYDVEIPAGDFVPDSLIGESMNLGALTAGAPTITSLSQTSGTKSGGTTVMITGSNLAGIDSVTFGGVSATVVSTTATSILVRTPAEYVATTPTESAFTNGTLWGLEGNFGANVTDAWSKTQGKPAVVVAVLDTGITTHTDLGAQVSGYDMISGLGVANDGNGRDANPADPGDWISQNDRDGLTFGGELTGCRVRDSTWHGTHVAGTVNASINGVGSVGVAPQVRVQNVRVLGKCGGFTSDIAAGIMWAAGGYVAGAPANPTPADVISLSLGARRACADVEQEAIDYALGQGAILTIAAGNDNIAAAEFAPGNCAGVITVAASDSSGKRAWFSNYGATVEIAAPGVDIFSTVNTGTTAPVAQDYVSWNGTSMATPHVAGVVALMLSRNPSLTPAQVLARIQDNPTAFGGGVCDVDPAKTCGSGIINAGLAVQ